LTSTQSSILSPQSFTRHWRDALWLIALIIYILAGTPIVPFHGDEATLIYMSRDYAYQFLQRDLNQIYYSETPVSLTQQELRLLNGTMSKYLYGLAWHIGGFQLEDINEQWDWGADWNYNQQNGHAPSDSLLLTARWASAIQTAVGAVVMFALGWALGGRKTAYLAALFYAINPIILLNGRRAMMEGSMLLFTTLTVLAALWLLRHPTWRRAVLFGLVAGLAIASKHTSLFTVASVFFATGMYFLLFHSPAFSWKARVTWYLTLLILAGIVTVGTFYLLNPAWWGSDPLTVGRYVLQIRERTIDEQITAFGGYDDFGDKPVGFWRQAVIGQPQYYEVSNWKDFIGDQIAQYEALVWRGVNVGDSIVGVVLLLVSVGAGIGALFYNKDTPVAARWLVGVWTVSVTAATLLLTPFEWQRYYLPAFPAIVLVAAYGLANLYTALSKFAIGYARTKGA
jgi:hypothetical protein